MRKCLLIGLAALAALAVLAYGPARGYFSGASANEQKRTHRKGPRTIPQVENLVEGVSLENLRFFDEADKASILFDVVNRTDRPVAAYIVIAGTYSQTLMGRHGRPALAPGQTKTGIISTDTIADETPLVLSAVRFADGEGRGEAEALRRIDENLKRPDPNPEGGRNR